MRIGINVFDIVFGEGSGPGAGRYVIELARHLRATTPDAELFLFVNPVAHAAGWFPQGPGCTQHVVPLDARKRWLRPLWEQFGLPVMARRLGLDLVHAPINSGPLLHPGVPTVVTVTDLAYFYYAQRYPAGVDIKARYYRTLQPLMFRRATHLIAISEFTRREILRHLRLDPERITAVLLGPGQSVGGSDRDALDTTDARDTLLSVGSGMLHKNLPRLIEAFAQANLPAAVRLAIVGEIPAEPRPRMVTQAQLRQQAVALGIGDRVVVRGYVPTDELRALYRRALAFVFPSLYEGFGLPVLEAMRYGIPVACSRSAALPEVGGAAALYFDGEDAADMARALRALAGDPTLRASLVAAGHRRVGTFSWERVALQTLDVYRRAAAQRG